MHLVDLFRQLPDRLYSDDMIADSRTTRIFTTTYGILTSFNVINSLKDGESRRAEERQQHDQTQPVVGVLQHAFPNQRIDLIF